MVTVGDWEKPFGEVSDFMGPVRASERLSRAGELWGRETTYSGHSRLILSQLNVVDGAFVRRQT